MTTIAPAPPPASAPPTADQLRRLESEGGLEYVGGQLLEKPVSIDSSRVEATILILLGNAARQTGSADVFSNSMGYQCYAGEPNKYRKPDVSVVRTERIAKLDPDTGFMPIPADLAVQVLSPNDLAYDVAEKTEEYLSNGFPLVWLVHPNTRVVTVYRADGSVTVLHENDEITGEAALPEFRCKVADFFPKRA